MLIKVFEWFMDANLNPLGNDMHVIVLQYPKSVHVSLLKRSLTAQQQILLILSMCLSHGFMSSFTS